MRVARHLAVIFVLLLTISILCWTTIYSLPNGVEFVAPHKPVALRVASVVWFNRTLPARFRAGFADLITPSLYAYQDCVSKPPCNGFELFPSIPDRLCSKWPYPPEEGCRVFLCSYTGNMTKYCEDSVYTDAVCGGCPYRFSRGCTR